MNPRTLDHVALWTDERDTLAAFTTDHLGMHVIERTDRFTLVGHDARRGKLTLFDAEGPRAPGALLHVALRVSDLDVAARELPVEPRAARADGALAVDAPGGLRVLLVESPTESEWDLDHVALRSADPASARNRYEQLGFDAASPGANGHSRVTVGGAFV